MRGRSAWEVSRVGRRLIAATSLLLVHERGRERGARAQRALTERDACRHVHRVWTAGICMAAAGRRENAREVVNLCSKQLNSE